jgi:YfiH family protein
MKSTRIEFIRPENLNNARIFSWFSLKNPGLHANDHEISGLNIGLNTAEGQTALLENLHTLSQEIKTSIKDIALAEQVHGDRVKVVESGGIYSESDAFVTSTPGLAIAIQVADCGAILFGDPMNQVIGAAHAGWRGAVAGIVPKTIQQMQQLGADVDNIRVFIGPCLSLHNFEVGEEVSDLFPDNFVDHSYVKPHVDLKGYIHQQLIDAGINGSYITIDERCTIDHDSLFYSYRREKEKSGRMAAIIKLNKLK